MIKKIISSGSLFVVFFSVMAQTPACIPNPLYKDSSSGVYPLPYDATLNPKGGIDKPACIGKPYEYVLTLKIDSVIVRL